MFDLEWALAFNGADIVFTVFVIAADIVAIYLARTFFKKI